MLSGHQRAFERACFGHQPSEEALHTLGAMPERWLLYRRMVRSRLHEMLLCGLPRTARCAGDALFGATFGAWLAEAPPRTRYIREVVPAFVDFALPRWRDRCDVDAHLLDLARYERTRWEVGYLQVPRPELGEFAFDRIPVVNPALRLLRVSHRVHESGAPDAPCSEGESCLCVFRKPDTDRVATWVLKPFTVWLMREWIGGPPSTTTASVKRVAAAHSLEIDPRFVEVLGATLADLLSAGMLLGARDDE